MRPPPLIPRPGPVCALLLLVALAAAGCFSGPGPGDNREGLSPVRTPAQEHATFRLEPGLRIELVASEPLVEDPVAMTFDAEGRLWVVEMRGFMPDLDGPSDESPIGRIKILTDTDRDGRMDEAVIFLDSLVLPRAVAVVPGGALVAENKPLWMVYDDDGDLRADRRVLIDSAYGGAGLPEHSANGLWRGIDNWYYNAKSSSRYRLRHGRWLRDSTEFRGQWGISHDDAGRLFYNYNWSQLHTDLVPPNMLGRNPHHTPTSGLNVGIAQSRRVFPIRATPAANRGYIPGALDDQGRLLEFTSAGAPFIYRGTALPGHRGNAFVCEPVGNLVKRNILTSHGLTLIAEDATPEVEFLASTDERFRPVFLTSGPDGALYVVDMYRGIIQDGVYMTPYLREQTEQRRLDQPIHHGRIWRIVPERWTPPGRIELAGATSRELVALLSDEDGWIRDTAQRLLVERADPAIVPFLERVAMREIDRLGRLHALWTLDGLDALTLPVLLKAIDDRDLRVRAAAIRIFAHEASRKSAFRESLADALSVRWAKAPPEIALAITLAAGALDANAALPILAGILGMYREDALFRDAAMSSLADREWEMLERLWSQWEWRTESPGRAVFIEMLAAATVRRGEAAQVEALFDRLDDPAFGWRQEALLAGLGTHRAGVLAISVRPRILDRLDAFPPDTRERLEALDLRFAWPGHTPAEPDMAVSSASVDPAVFALGRQHYLSVCAACHGNAGAGMPSLAPPLAGSEWVTGADSALVRILLHGLEGPIDVAGRRYDAPDILPEMPAFAVLDDAAIAATLTYIRNAWGHDAGPVTRQMVGTTRVTTQGRVTPWTAAELKAFITPSP